MNRIMFPPTLAMVNFVLDPLGAAVEPDIDPDDIDREDFCEDPKLCLKLVKIRDTLVVPQEDANPSVATIPAYVSPGCDVPMGLAPFIWPAYLAAECIVRSIFDYSPKFCLNSDNADCYPSSLSEEPS